MPTTTPNPCPVPKACKMKPDELVRALLRAKWAQDDIAAAVEVSQATISRMLSGRHKSPRYEVVDKLRELVLKLDEFQVAA